MDYDQLATILVNSSLTVRSGEVVSLLGASQAEPLLVALYRAVLRVGGHPLLLIKSTACEEMLWRYGNSAQLTFVDPLETREVNIVDAAIHVLSLKRCATAIDPARLCLYQHARQPLLERFWQRTAAGTLRWTATLFADANTEEERLLWRAAFLDQPDPVAAWRRQEARQARLIERLQQARMLRIVTRTGTDLRLDSAGRFWTNGAGRHNFPDGEIYVAPCEGTVEGTVYFDFPSVVSNQEVRGIRLRLRAGRVIEASATTGADYLQPLLDPAGGAGVVAEVALGCNYALDRPVGHPLLDEKIGGTFHLGLGAMPDRGRPLFHWDLIGDLRCGGRVEADGAVISVDGRFVDPAWPGPLAVPGREP